MTNQPKTELVTRQPTHEISIQDRDDAAPLVRAPIEKFPTLRHAASTVRSLAFLNNVLFQQKPFLITMAARLQEEQPCSGILDRRGRTRRPKRLSAMSVDSS